MPQFYELQPTEEKEKYKEILKAIGALSRIYSESECPYLYYRTHENVFCKYFNAENLARHDCSADAKKEHIGIGLKTWVGSDDQKVAEFGQLRPSYANLEGMELVRKISEYRNERIRITKNLYNIEEMIYSIVKRTAGHMNILEHSFDYIDLDNITLIPDRGNANNTYFSDGHHTYHFSKSKSTLYMLFEDLIECESIPVDILDDPYDLLLSLSRETLQEQAPVQRTQEPQLCLRLYSTKADGTKFVAEKSGLNQWNASGRPRHPDELYIPYPALDRHRNPNFFPDRDTVFNLTLPDGTTIPAKVCQQDSKAIMSNPNKVLGNWLLRKVFELQIGTVVTYEMLERFGIDSVVFTKNGHLNYSIDFAEIGTYEQFYQNDIESLE